MGMFGRCTICQAAMCFSLLITMAGCRKSSKLWSTSSAILCKGIICSFINMGTSKSILGMWNSAEIISVQNAWLSQQNQVLKAVSDAEGGEISENEGTSDDSQDGFPPLERNMNHLNFEESEDESE
ncbi:uncharacterized protein LOC133672720 isoform X2 [Populus nigra]|uniref:uncharacterized protein LOC133672720 isoform X2 n=2 Tax=Populus nigra TaxID=3691 RepID=UPI002B26A245|nr:uncharacterized protein LOC133672720 isoform X2 [Populus nigra]